MQENTKYNGEPDILGVFKSFSSPEIKYEFARKTKENQAEISKDLAGLIIDFLSGLKNQPNTEHLDMCYYFKKRFSLSCDLRELYRKNNRQDLIAKEYESLEVPEAKGLAKREHLEYLKAQTGESFLNAVKQLSDNKNPTYMENFKNLQKLAEEKGLVSELIKEVFPYLFSSKWIDRAPYAIVRADIEILDFWKNFFRKYEKKEYETMLDLMRESAAKDIKDRISKNEKKKFEKEAEKRYDEYLVARRGGFGNYPNEGGGNLNSRTKLLFFSDVGQLIWAREYTLTEITLRTAQKAIESAEKAEKPGIIKKIKQRLAKDISRCEFYETRINLQTKFGLVEEAKKEYLAIIDTKEKEGKFDEALAIAKKGNLEEKVSRLNAIIQAINPSKGP